MSYKARIGKIKGFGLVRDKDGNPKINDYENCSNEIKAMLTQEERAFFEKQNRGNKLCR